MSEISVQVVHSVPGRIRVRWSWLDSDLNSEDIVQKQVQSLNAVEAVRVNPKARSVIVEYNPHQVSEADFRKTLIALLQSNPPGTVLLSQERSADISKPQLPPDCLAIDLTPYEQLQFENILAWKHRNISWFKELSGRVFLSAQGLLKFFFLNKVFEEVASVFESVTIKLEQDWEKLKPIAGVDDVTALRRGTLERCDRLTEHVIQTALEQVTIQATIDGLFEVFGEVADETLTLILSLQIIHQIGLCYGYKPETPDEQAFVWAIFNAALAITQETFLQTQVTIRNLQHSLNKQALEDEALVDTLAEDVSDLLVDSVIEQGIAQLTGETLGAVIPVLSSVMDIFADHEMVEQVGDAAKREFQQRWLLENQKVCFPDLLRDDKKVKK